MNSDAYVTNWRTSSYSNGTGNCVEVGTDASHVRVRDTKFREGGSIGVSSGSWDAFITGVKAGQFDLK